MAKEIYVEEFSVSVALRFLVQEKLGSGTFGEVRRAIDRHNGDYVAIKYIPVMSRDSSLPKAVFREMESLKRLSGSCHVVNLFETFTEDTKLCLVMEYVKYNLADIISSRKSYFPRCQLKIFMKMIIESIHYCHSHSIIHRDIKPSNLLISSGGMIKLADFGLARILDDHIACKDLSHQVATRWYRPPELLFASRSYDFSSDMWSVGVVFAEMLALLPLFPGNNDIDQMYKVFQILGSPTEDVWPGVSALPDYPKVNFPNMNKIPFQLLIPNSHPADIEFMEQFVVLNPRSRLTALQASTHAYFLQQPLPQSRHLSIQEYYSCSHECQVAKSNFISRDELLNALTANSTVPASESSKAVDDFVLKCTSIFDI